MCGCGGTVDAPASGAGSRKAVWVQIPPSAPNPQNVFVAAAFTAAKQFKVSAQEQQILVLFIPSVVSPVKAVCYPYLFSKVGAAFRLRTNNVSAQCALRYSRGLPPALCEL